jgi:RIO kinase 1
VFVKVDRYERESDRKIEGMGIRIKDADQLKVREDVFDEVTLLALYKLVHKKYITAIGGSISTGKEANIFFAECGSDPLAIKIYRIRTANFNAMSEYLIGDRRFSNVKRSKKDLIFAWTRKEYSNLLRAHKAGVPVPVPVVWDRNILVMGFLGEGERPFPQLRNVELDDPESVYATIVSYVKILYEKAGLVHADLSEFNILYGDIPYLIDMGQSVTRDHPQALRFLMRDLIILNRFFGDLCETRDERALFSELTGIPMAR